MSNSIEKRQLLYVIIGTSISIIFGLIYDIIIPYFGNFNFYWFGPIMTVIFIIATSYSIFKHSLFNIRVIATELLTFAIWIFVLVRMLLANNLQERLINGGLLLFLIISGILLIRSVLQEVKTREELAVANEKLKELDKAKSEFVSIASHDLRIPVTGVRGYASMILEGSFGGGFWKNFY